MNQYKSGKWMGEKEKKPLFPSFGEVSRPAAAAVMAALGIVIAVVAGELPVSARGTLALSVSASGYHEEYAPPVSSDTAGENIVSELPGCRTVFTQLLSEPVEEEGFDPDKYTTFPTAQEISEKAAEDKRNAKLTADNAHRYRNSGATVSSGNRGLYLSGYHYNNSQPTGAGYTPLNSQGIPMSEYTMPSDLILDANGVPQDYSYCIEGTATAYYTTGLTATGTYTYQGTVAVDPREIPYGTEMWITSADGRYVYGYCRAEDTGGFIYFSNGATVDLYMRSYSDCVSWGKRGVKIYVLSR